MELLQERERLGHHAGVGDGDERTIEATPLNPPDRVEDPAASTPSYWSRFKAWRPWRKGDVAPDVASDVVAQSEDDTESTTSEQTSGTPNFFRAKASTIAAYFRNHTFRQLVLFAGILFSVVIALGITGYIYQNMILMFASNLLGTALVASTLVVGLAYLIHTKVNKHTPNTFLTTPVITAAVSVGLGVAAALTPTFLSMLNIPVNFMALPVAFLTPASHIIGTLSVSELFVIGGVLLAGLTAIFHAIHFGFHQKHLAKLELAADARTNLAADAETNVEKSFYTKWKSAGNYRFLSGGLMVVGALCALASFTILPIINVDVALAVASVGGTLGVLAIAMMMSAFDRETAPAPLVPLTARASTTGVQGETADDVALGADLANAAARGDAPSPPPRQRVDGLGESTTRALTATGPAAAGAERDKAGTPPSPLTVGRIGATLDTLQTVVDSSDERDTAAVDSSDERDTAAQETERRRMVAERRRLTGETEKLKTELADRITTGKATRQTVLGAGRAPDATVVAAPLDASVATPAVHKKRVKKKRTNGAQHSGAPSSPSASDSADTSSLNPAAAVFTPRTNGAFSTPAARVRPTPGPKPGMGRTVVTSPKAPPSATPDTREAPVAAETPDAAGPQAATTASDMKALANFGLVTKIGLVTKNRDAFVAHLEQTLAGHVTATPVAPEW